MTRTRSEAGFTIIEAVIAALLLSLGAIAVLTAFDGARRATYRAEASQVASDIAQRELEALRQKSYAQLAMTAQPGAPGPGNDPRSRVSGTSFALTKEGTNPAAMVINGGSKYGGGTIAGGTVDPGPSPFTSGDISGSVHRFVVWQNDPNCTDDLCPGPQDYKRLVVAVTLDPTASGGLQGYSEVQSDGIDPTDSVASNPSLPQFGTPTVAQQFWLTDQRCLESGEPPRDATTAPSNHATHDTRGQGCAVPQGTEPERRPDALATTSPPLAFNDINTMDYATDLEPAAAGADAGLQLQLPSQGGCTLLPQNPLSSGREANETHLWVSKPVNIGGPYAMTGGSTLKLWTRSVNDVSVSGRLCVVLFTRAQTGVTTAVDTVRASVTSNQVTWPSGEWKELTVPLVFSPATLPLAGNKQRIGLAIGLDRAGGTSNEFQFQYDTVSFESRLEVETTTPLAP